MLALLLSVVAPLSRSTAQDADNTQDAVTTQDAESDQKVEPAADLEELLTQAKSIRERYRRWGLKRTTEIYEIPKMRSVREAHGVVSQGKPKTTYSNQFLVNEGLFRVDRNNRYGNPISYAFDGELARFRGKFVSYNGHPKWLRNYFLGNASPGLPHFVMSQGLFMGDFYWVFDYDLQTEFIDVASRKDLQHFSQETWNGFDCWKLVTTFQNSHGDVVRSRAWLSKQHDLLPVRFISTRLDFSAVHDLYEFRLNELQQVASPHGTLWFPKRSTTTFSAGINLEQFVSTYTSAPIDTPGIYSKLPLRSVSVGRKRSLVAKDYEPERVFDQYSQVANRLIGVSSVPNFRFWGPLTLLLGFVFLAVVLPFWRTRTRSGAWVRDFVVNRPGVMFSLGLVMMLLTYRYTSGPKGWEQYGISMVFAAMVGFAMIVITMLLAGRKVFSLNLIFAIAACSAVLFAGYNRGFQQLRSRQTMIQDIRGSGGQVQLISWETSPDGISVPAPLDQFISESWTSQLTRATIPAEIFDRKHARRWCLKEGERLHISRLDYQPFRVDHDAVYSLSGAPDLWRLDFNRGILEDRHFEAFKEIPALESLGFDCDGKPLPTMISKLRGLTELNVSRVHIDASFFETLRRLPRLENLVLVQPSFEDEFASASSPTIEGLQQIKFLTVQYAKLDPRTMGVLGRFPSEVTLQNCQLAKSGQATFSLAETKAIRIENSVFRDQDLLALEEIPNLELLGMSETNVTLKGFETFAKRNPGMGIEVR